jgi:hypothetical protein
LLNNQLIQTKLLRSTLEHTFLDAVLGDEPKDVHLLRLSNSMSAVHSLEIGLRIPSG